MIDWHREYAQLRALWRKHPELYAKQRLGLNPTWQQRNLLKAIAASEARVSVRSGHGMRVIIEGGHDFHPRRSPVFIEGGHPFS